MPRKPAASKPEPTPEGAAASSAEPAAAEPAAPTEPVPTQESPAVASAPVQAAAPAALPPSFLDRVRANRMGPLTAGLAVALLVALLLAVLVPERPNLYAYSVLALLLTAAVGFTVRYLTRSRGLWSQGTAFVATAIGIHVMSITGTLDGVGGGAAAGLLSQIGLSGPGFDDALLGALATPAVSTGGVLCGLVAAIIVGWGKREPHADHH
ncbi:hypothetical protein [Demequina sp.]|uniref:hypothetical protein n=1 Tax=Demequina sp. TaxID=2050685 RepID=UPI0025DA2BF2|nr:hypothetical protein [Demequina sp.]